MSVSLYPFPLYEFESKEDIIKILANVIQAATGIGVMVTAKPDFFVNKGFFGEHERLRLDKASEKTVENNYDLPY